MAEVLTEILGIFGFSISLFMIGLLIGVKCTIDKLYDVLSDEELKLPGRYRHVIDSIIEKMEPLK